MHHITRAILLAFAHEPTATNKEVCKIVGRSEATVCEALQELAREGYVMRHTMPTHRKVSVTAKGRKELADNPRQLGCTLSDLQVALLHSLKDNATARNADIAAEHGLSTSAVERNTRVLVAEGWLHKEGKTADRKLTLTARGLEAISTF